MTTFRPPGDYRLFAAPPAAEPPPKRKRRATAPKSVAVQALTVLRELRRRWCTIAHLAALIDRDPKTARRMLAAVRTAGFRVRAKTEDYGRRRYRVK